MKGKKFIGLKYTPAIENSANLESGGCDICRFDYKWQWEGPKQWPEQPQSENYEESEMQRKKVIVTLAIAFTTENVIDKLLLKFQCIKTFRVLN